MKSSMLKEKCVLVGTFITIAVFILAMGSAFAADVGLTTDGKVPGKPFEYLQQQIDAIELLPGPPGPQGPAGPTGAEGLQGPQGEQGPKGDTGAIGPKGDKGDKGDTGAIGPQGPIGLTGPKGDTGAIGPQGPAGVTSGITRAVQGVINIANGTYVAGQGIENVEVWSGSGSYDSGYIIFQVHFTNRFTMPTLPPTCLVSMNWDEPRNDGERVIVSIRTILDPIPPYPGYPYALVKVRWVGGHPEWAGATLSIMCVQ